MKLNRNEHCKFVQRLDRTAERNPLLWLPCVMLLAVILGVGEISDKLRHSEKPIGMRFTAMAAAVAFTLMFLPELDAAVSLNVSAANVVASGDCGDQGNNVTWVLDDEGTLTISGTGAMEDYTGSGNTIYTPWYDNRDTITKVIISSGITSIGNYSFAYCTNITAAELTNGLISIGDFAFENCQSLPNVIIPDSVAVIGNSAFSECQILNEIVIPNSVNTIGSGAFFDCRNLKSVIIPEGVTIIDINTFYGCRSLNNVSIPRTVVSIEACAFSTCKSLENISLPDGLTQIGGNAFSTCTSLTEIKIPDSVTSIGSGAFHNCPLLESIEIPSGVIELKSWTFDSCSNLKKIIIPRSVITFSEYSLFTGCNADLTIYSYHGSAAETYAKDNNIAFEIYEHDYTDGWKYDDEYHWQKCSFCDYSTDKSTHTWDEGAITKEPTATEAGEKTFTCAECGCTKTETIPATGTEAHIHNYGYEWKYNNSYHWRECSCGDITDHTEHTKDTGTVITAPTETAEGVMRYSCIVCGYRWDETIPATGIHIHSFGTDWRCDSEYHWHECSCGERADLAAHISDGGIVNVQPTATTNGVRAYSCTVCGCVLRTETIPAYGGTYIPVTDTNQNTAENNSAPIVAREPFIADDPSIIGWDAIIPVINFTPDGERVTVDMNGTDELPERAVTSIMGRDIILRLKMGGGVYWTINGLNVTNPKTVNMRVSTSSQKVPDSVIDSMGSEKKAKQFRIYHSGNFGFTADLTLTAGKSYNDYYATLFYYNTKTKQLEYSGTSVVSNNSMTFEFTHASYYAVSFNKEPLYNDVSSGAPMADNSAPVDFAIPTANGVSIHAIKLPQIAKYSTKRRKYRILRRRRLDDLVFVF